MFFKKRSFNPSVTFLCCVLGVPTCITMIPGIAVTDMNAAVIAGIMLGFAYLILRPALRVVTLPIGCLTLGLFNTAIDVGLLYGCAYLIEGFDINSIWAALAAALFINIMAAVTGAFNQ